ncbi:MAG: ATP-binding cassette domain-containing protein, partial [Candidatus Limnocylindrales bacterium]
VYGYFPRLRERLGQPAGQLSGGEQQMLAIGRALLTNPRLLVMDEPSEGLAPTIVSTLVETCRTLLAEGVSLLLVEQNLGVATALADRILIMLTGEVVHETTAQALLADVAVQRRFLGVEPVIAAG